MLICSLPTISPFCIKKLRFVIKAAYHHVPLTFLLILLKCKVLGLPRRFSLHIGKSNIPNHLCKYYRIVQPISSLENVSFKCVCIHPHIVNLIFCTTPFLWYWLSKYTRYSKTDVISKVGWTLKILFAKLRFGFPHVWDTVSPSPILSSPEREILTFVSWVESVPASGS